jgi:hypothetical protein
MSSLNTLTGREGEFVVDDGAAALIARSTTWAVSPSVLNSEWGDSGSGGFTNRAAGRRDCTFTAEGKYDSVTEVFDLFYPGDIVIATLWLDSTVASLYWDFPRALCIDFSLTVDMDTEDVIGWTTSWGADGAYTFPGQSGAAARTIP